MTRGLQNDMVTGAEQKAPLKSGEATVGRCGGTDRELQKASPAVVAI